MFDSWRICPTCGRELEVAAGKSLAEALRGWYILSIIKEGESFDRVIFCSLACLSRWTQGQLPRVPDVFRRSLDDGVVS
jgi:hypothetical protein